MPLVSFTLANFLSAEFGFLGVMVPTLVQTPLLKGLPLFPHRLPIEGLFLIKLKFFKSAGVFDLFSALFLGFLTNCCIVDILFGIILANK